MVRPRAATVLRSLSIPTVFLIAAACTGSPASSPAASTQATAAPPATTSPAASASSGSSSSPEASSSVEPPAGASEGPSAGASEGASGATGGGSTLALQAKDFSYSGPATATAGVTTITLQNTGKETHQAQLVKINTGKTFSDLTAALATGDPAAALALVSVSGGPNGVRAGETGQSTQNLEPGNYAFLCFISGADGIPHVAKGMIAPLTVTGTASAGSVPAGDATVEAKDFSFDVPGPLPAGQHTFLFKNTGPQPHEAGIIKLNAGVTVDQLKGIFTASPAPSGQAPQGPPPWQDYGGIGAIAPGSTASFTVNLEAGQQYAFICFVPDPATGKAHAELGMIAAIPTQ